MTGKEALLAALEFSRQRLLGLLEGIEKSGADVQQVLAWRPAPGRAHLAWQAMHCAATHDRYVNLRLLGNAGETDTALCAAYGGGSTPADGNIPTLGDIRATLEKHYLPFKRYIAECTDADLAKVLDFPNGVKRTVGESIVLLTWHEGHHQGQMHLTWNMYKAAHGIK